MLINAEILDIKKGADEGDLDSQLLLFWAFAKGEMTSQNDALAIYYLEKFLNNEIENCIDSCLRINSINLEYSESVRTIDERFFQYIYHLCIVGVFAFEHQNFSKAALWFKKAIDLTDDYLKYTDAETQNILRYNITAYAYWFDGMIEHFNEKMYNNFLLDWEKKKFFGLTAANNN